MSRFYIAPNHTLPNYLIDVPTHRLFFFSFFLIPSSYPTTSLFSVSSYKYGCNLRAVRNSLRWLANPLRSQDNATDSRTAFSLLPAQHSERRLLALGKQLLGHLILFVAHAPAVEQIQSVLTLEPSARAHLDAVFTSPRIRPAGLPRHCKFLPHLPAGRPVYGDKNMVHTGFSSGFSSFIIFSVVHTGSYIIYLTYLIDHGSASTLCLTAVLCDSQAEQEMVTNHLDNLFIRYPSKIKS
ncbi:hypothetical protein B0H19DRAFT_1071556 [Mycena capillaripes]|nr:hypothetical protein B0H19DRAFT_1071556 [Mycena capillaripes]